MKQFIVTCHFIGEDWNETVTAETGDDAENDVFERLDEGERLALIALSWKEA